MRPATHETAFDMLRIGSRLTKVAFTWMFLVKARIRQLLTAYHPPPPPPPELGPGAVDADDIEDEKAVPRPVASPTAPTVRQFLPAYQDGS
jgi:hypothetical protein